jgi:glycerol-3-phosphate dehydrogenase (NAD(P)+)
MRKISIYGIGNFGFALLKHLDKKADKGQFSLHMYDRNKKLRDSLRKEGVHLIHHKNIKISKNVVVEESPKNLVNGADILILAVTSNAIKEVVSNIKSYINKKIIILNTAKALDSTTGERPSVIIKNSLKGVKYPVSVAMMAGGTIAKDLFYENPLGADIACKNKKTLETLKDIFVSDNLNVYTTSDIVGVEYAAAFKNVVSISAGIMKGLNFSYGSETHIISRLSGEIKKLVVTKLGGKCATFSTESQCWGNDMLMSATGNTRNREFGILIGKGYDPKKALEKMKKENKTVEGINTVKVIKKIMNKYNYNPPLLYEMSVIILKNKDPKKSILSLMASNKI